MENNQINNTMNLGNNVGGANPSIFGNVTNANIPSQQPSSAEQINLNYQATAGYAQPVQPQFVNETIGTTVASAPVNAEINVQAPVTPINEVVVTTETTTTTEDKINETQAVKGPILIKGDITVPTILLREMTSQARKVGVSNNMQPLSEVLNLIINENGITMRATSGKGKQDIEIVDNKYVFTSSLNVSLDIKVFSEYLNVARSEVLTLKFVESENTLYITTDNGERKFAQRVDGSTHQPVVHELHYPIAYDDMIPVNYERLKTLLALNSSARDLATKSFYEYLKGMYCGEDIVVSSDGNIMTIQPNQTEFNNKIFFLNNDVCKLISELAFDSSKFRIGFTEANGFLAGITISDGRITICGPIDINESFPVEVARNFWTSNGFIQGVTVETKAFLDVIKSVIPFIPVMGEDLDKLIIDIKDDEMIVKCSDNTAREVLAINNTANYATTKSIILPASKLDKLVQTIQADTFELMIDAQVDNYICLSYDNLRSIVTTLN